MSVLLHLNTPKLNSFPGYGGDSPNEAATDKYPIPHSSLLNFPTLICTILLKVQRKNSVARGGWSEQGASLCLLVKEKSLSMKLLARLRVPLPVAVDFYANSQVCRGSCSY